MAVGAWDFFALIWNHPFVSCLVMLLFTPALFPIVVYFSPLLISTALCAIALISMNMADSPETEDDPYLRRWQSEQVETEQSKPARQSWSQWVTKVEERTRVWVDSRFTRGKQAQDDKFKWKVIHDDDDENDVSVPSDPPILPLAGKPTKIKYGTRTDDEDCEAEDVSNKALDRSALLSTTKAGEKQEEIQSVFSVNVQPAAASILQPRNVITRAPATQVVDTSTTQASYATLITTEQRPASSGLHALAEEIPRPPAKTSQAGPNSLDKFNILPTPSLSETRDEPERREHGSFKAFTISVDGVAQRVVQDHASHASPLYETVGPVTTQSPPVASVQHAAVLTSATTPLLSTSQLSSFGDTNSETASTARSLVSNLEQQTSVVANAAPAAQSPSSDQVWPEKVGTNRSLPSNLVSIEGIVDSEPEAPAVSVSAGPGTAIRAPVSMHLPSMNERTAEARMRKPEPIAYRVKSGDVGDMETSAQYLDAQKDVVEESAAVGKKGDQPVSRSGLGESEIGRPSAGKVHAGTQLNESGIKGLSDLSTEATPSCVATGSLEENEVGLTDFEKVIFVDESSKLGNCTVSGQHKVAADGTKLLTEVVEDKGSGRIKGDGQDLLKSEQSLGSSDTKGKSIGRLEGATIDDSYILARATISSHPAEANQFHMSIVEERSGEQSSSDKAGFCRVDDIIKPGSAGYGVQPEISPLEISEVLGSSGGSRDASSVDRKKSDKDLEGKGENLCAVQTSGGRCSIVDSLNGGVQGHDSTADQSQNIIEEVRSLSGLKITSDLNSSPRSDVELNAAHKVIPQSGLDATVETVSSKKNLQPGPHQQRSLSLNNKEDRQGGKERVWCSASVDDEAARDSTASRNAWVKANNEEEYDEYMKEYLLLKNSSSMPSSSRQDENARKISSLGKAFSLPEKKNRDEDDSDSDSGAVVPVRKNPWIRNHSVDSVEEITARLSKKYNWAKVPAREVSGTSRPVSTLAVMDAPKPIEPEIFAINSPRESLSSHIRKGIDSEKTDEPAESYLSPMKKVLSAVRNVGSRDKDGSGKTGHPQASERKGLSYVLNIKRERFTSPLKRVLKSEADGGKRAGSTNERKEKSGTTLALAVLAEEEGGPTNKFKDRLVTPVKKAFSTEATGGGGGKKPDIAQDSTPALLRASPAHKKRHVRDEMAADGKFRDRFILPLKKKFSSESKDDRKKRDSAGAADRSGPLTNDTSGGDAMSTSDRVKSPDKKFILSWTKKRAKDDQSAAPLQAQEEISPGSIFEKPRSPGISDKTTARLISHEKSNTSVKDEVGYATDEFRSPERNFFWPLSNQEKKMKEKESSQTSKEKMGGGKTSSWWARKRDKVVVEEAVVALAKQPTRDDARSSPERIIAGRSIDNGVYRLTSADTISPASSSLKWRENDEQQPFPVRSGPSEERVSAAGTHRREHSDTLPTRFRTHERRMSLSELSTPETESTSAERMSIFDQGISMPERVSSFEKSSTLRKSQHARQRSIDITDVKPEAHLYKSRSATGAVDHAQERCKNEIVPFTGSRSDPEVNKLYRNLDSPSTSNAEIRITDKLKVPLEEVLSLLAAGDSSTRNSTAARESSSSEETSSSEEEWSSSSDEDEAEPAAVPVQKGIQAVQSRKSHNFFNKGNRQLRNVDA